MASNGIRYFYQLKEHALVQILKLMKQWIHVNINKQLTSSLILDLKEHTTELAYVKGELESLNSYTNITIYITIVFAFS